MANAIAMLTRCMTTRQTDSAVNNGHTQVCRNCQEPYFHIMGGEWCSLCRMRFELDHDLFIESWTSPIDALCQKEERATGGYRGWVENRLRSEAPELPRIVPSDEPTATADVAY